MTDEDSDKIKKIEEILKKLREEMDICGKAGHGNINIGKMCGKCVQNELNALTKIREIVTGEVK